LVDANGEFSGAVSPATDIPFLKFGGGDHGEGIGSIKVGSANLNGLEFCTNYTDRMRITHDG
jgi:hypothetical protein